MFVAEEMDLLDYVNIVRRRWWLIAAIVFIGCVSALGYGTYVQKPVYEAAAKLVMTGVPGEDKGPPDRMAIEGSIMMIETYKELVTTPVVLKRVTEAHAELRMTEGQIASKLQVNSSLTSQMMTITVQDGSYERAAQLVNAVSAALVEETRLLYDDNRLQVLYEAEYGPHISPSPVSMSIKMILVLAFVVSVIISIGLSVLFEYLDRTIKTERDITRSLQVPVLAELELHLDNGRLRGSDYNRQTARRAEVSRDVPIEK